MKKILLFLLLCVIVSNLKSQTLFQYDNLRFEKGYEGAIPVSWQFPKKFIDIGCRADLTSNKKLEGNLSVKITNSFSTEQEINPKEKYSNFFQSIDAIPYRNKKVRFMIAIASDFLNTENEVKVWIQTRAVKDSVSSESVVVNEFKDKDWHYLAVETNVDRNTNEIRFGVMFRGAGELFADDANFEVVQPEGYSFERANPIKENHIGNFLVLAKMYGYARYFYPSLESQFVDWERFLYNLIYLAEDKGESDYLLELNRHFKQVAPLMEVYYKDKPFKQEYFKPKSAEKDGALGYRHSGAWSQRNNSMYFTEIRNIYLPTRIREAAVSQVIDVSKHKGKKVTFSANIKTDIIGPGSNAQIWLRGDDAASNMIFAITSEDKKAQNKNWQKYEISEKITDETNNLRLGLIFFGEGKAFFDNVELIVTDKKGKTEKISVRNPSFEEDETENLTRGWVTPASVISAGYSVSVTTGGIDKTKCMLISSDTTSIEYFPNPGEFYTADISNNLKISFPLTLYYDSLGTYPRTERVFDYSYSLKPKGYYPNPKDRASRILQTIQMWSALKHFSINDFDKIADSILINSLKKAAVDSEWNDFKATMKSTIKNLNDSQAKIWSADSTLEYCIPYLFELIGDKLIVTGVPDTITPIKPGDEILQINGKNSIELINELANLEGSSNSNFRIRKSIAEIRAGNVNTKISLKLKLNNDKIIDTVLIRNYLLNDIVEARPPIFAKFEDDIFYLDLTSIDDTRFVEFMKNIPEAKKFIFDLRGVTQMSEHFLGFFADETINSVNFNIPIYTKPDKKMVNKKMVNGIIEGYGKFSDAKLIFLTDERTVGYSEVIIATVKENSLGTIIGKPTAGTAGEATAIRLSGNINFSMTGMIAENSKGGSLWGKPVIPDIEVITTIGDIKANRDPILELGLELIQK